MSATPYFQSITSASIFETRYVAERAQPFSELEALSASKWGRQQLFACRLIRRQPQRNTLPVLDAFEATNTADFNLEMQQFVNGPDSHGHLGWSELALVRLYGHSLGQLWAALAMFQGPEARRKLLSKGNDENDEKDENDDNDDNNDGSGPPENPGRPTRSGYGARRQEGFVDSSSIQVGSSPVGCHGAQGSQGSASSIAYVDAASIALARQAEDGTVHFIRCAVRHVLCYAPPHAQPDMEAVVEFRDAQARATTEIHPAHKLVAVDDGGLCLRRRNEEAVFETVKNRVAMLEAKPHLHCFEEGRPIISDACLSQMTCEALAAREDDTLAELSHGSVIMIHAAQQYVCFLQFDISANHFVNLESVTPTSFMYVSSTPWYDLGSKEGRTNFARIMCSIMKWALASE